MEEALTVLLIYFQGVPFLISRGLRALDLRAIGALNLVNFKENLFDLFGVLLSFYLD